MKGLALDDSAKENNSNLKLYSDLQKLSKIGIDFTKLITNLEAKQHSFEELEESIKSLDQLTETASQIKQDNEIEMNKAVNTSMAPAPSQYAQGKQAITIEEYVRYQANILLYYFASMYLDILKAFRDNIVSFSGKTDNVFDAKEITQLITKYQNITKDTLGKWLNQMSDKKDMPINVINRLDKIVLTQIQNHAGKPVRSYYKPLLEDLAALMKETNAIKAALYELGSPDQWSLTQLNEYSPALIKSVENIKRIIELLKEPTREVMPTNVSITYNEDRAVIHRFASMIYEIMQTPKDFVLQKHEQIKQEMGS